MTTRDQLLLLPGLVCDARLWQPQVDALAGWTRCTVADLTGADSIAGLAASVLAQAPAGRFALAGLSLGGYVALEVMRQAPERVTALALLDSSARADTPATRIVRRTAMRRALTGFSGVIDGLLPKLLHPARRMDAALVATVRAMAGSFGAEVFVRQQQAILERSDSVATLATIRCPTLVLCGRQDAITPVELHQELAAGIRGAGLVIIEDCGHLSTLEQPARVAQALDRWLGTVRRRDRPAAARSRPTRGQSRP